MTTNVFRLTPKMEAEIRGLLEMIGPSGGKVHADYARHLVAEVDYLRSEVERLTPRWFPITCGSCGREMGSSTREGRVRTCSSCQVVASLQAEVDDE